jgi:hypothetical protein
MITYYMPAARNTVTGQRIKSQDLSGQRFSRFERDQAWLHAERLAGLQTARDRETWVPELIEYPA